MESPSSKAGSRRRPKKLEYRSKDALARTVVRPSTNPGFVNLVRVEANVPELEPDPSLASSVEAPESKYRKKPRKLELRGTDQKTTSLNVPIQQFGTSSRKAVEQPARYLGKLLPSPSAGSDRAFSAPPGSLTSEQSDTALSQVSLKTAKTDTGNLFRARQKLPGRGKLTAHRCSCLWLPEAKIPTEGDNRSRKDQQLEHA